MKIGTSKVRFGTISIEILRKILFIRLKMRRQAQSNVIISMFFHPDRRNGGTRETDDEEARKQENKKIRPINADWITRKNIISRQEHGQNDNG